MKNATCENCRFWDNSTQSGAMTDEGLESGLCRRGQPGHDSRTGRAVWPFTEDCDWCGEFKALAAKERPHG